MRAFLPIAAALLVSAACAPKAAPPPGDPLRPQSKTMAPVIAADKQVPVNKPLPQSPQDCDPIAPNEGPPHRPYNERNQDEGAAQASVGLKILFQSEDSSRAPEEISRLIEEAVDHFFAALNADPYNPRATYNLAAAYARIGRNQCALNLLARLVAMRHWREPRKAIGGHLDRLFGRGKKWRGRPDPDFNKLRDKESFRDIVKPVM